MTVWSKAEKDDALATYGCEIIVADGTWDQVNTKDAPRDAKIVKYELNGELHYDLTKPSKNVKLFDIFGDSSRGGFVGWNFGNGIVN